MNQAIVTKFIAPSERRGMRVKATCAGGKTKMFNWESDWDADKNHHTAAIILQAELEWQGELKGGVMANGDYCWVLVPVEKPSDAEWWRVQAGIAGGMAIRRSEAGDASHVRYLAQNAAHSAFVSNPSLRGRK